MKNTTFDEFFRCIRYYGFHCISGKRIDFKSTFFMIKNDICEVKIENNSLIKSKNKEDIKYRML